MVFKDMSVKHIPLLLLLTTPGDGQYGIFQWTELHCHLRLPSGHHIKIRINVTAPPCVRDDAVSSGHVVTVELSPFGRSKMYVLKPKHFQM